MQAAYVTGQRLRGYVVTDLQINTTMDISLSHGIPIFGIQLESFYCFAEQASSLFLKQWMAKVKHRMK